MNIGLNEIITKKAKTLVNPLTAYLRKHAVYIYCVRGELTSTYFLSKSSAYAQMEVIKATADSDLNSHEIIREEYHDLDNRLDSFTLSSGVTFEITSHRILW